MGGTGEMGSWPIIEPPLKKYLCNSIVSAGVLCIGSSPSPKVVSCCCTTQLLTRMPLISASCHLLGDTTMSPRSACSPVYRMLRDRRGETRSRDGGAAVMERRVAISRDHTLLCEMARIPSGRVKPLQCVLRNQCCLYLLIHLKSMLLSSSPAS